MKIQSLSAEEALSALLTGKGGLSGEEAGRRLDEYGPNRLKEAARRPLPLRLLSHTTHFLAIVLWLAAGLAFFSDRLNPGQGMSTLGFAIVGVIIINALFTSIEEYKAEKSLEELKKLLPFRVRVVRDEKETEAPAEEIVPGDLIILSEGDKVPADARLIDSARLMVNNAPLTGEPDSKPRGPEPFEGSFTESPNIVFAGTSVLSGRGKAVVYATGMATEFGKIAHLTGETAPGPSPLQKELRKATRIVASLATAMGVLFFFFGFFTGRSFWENFIFAIGIIVANVPEGLLPTVTLSLAMGSQRMAKKKALIKTLMSVETLGSVTVICTDKTGTLTENKMKVKKIYFDGGLKSAKDSKTLMTFAYLCNNARLSEGAYTGDPTETALLEAAREAVGDPASERIMEIPFDSERKRMTTVNLLGGKKTVITKGAFESVLPLSSSILSGEKHLEIDEDRKGGLMETYYEMMDSGLRVLAFAFKETDALPEEKDAESGLCLAGLIGLEDPPRPEVGDAVKKCREAGIRVIMFTGDGSRTAAAIAREIGLSEKPRTVEGEEFARMTDEELRGALGEKEIIFARMTPKYKMRLVSVLQDEGERVAVTGDGVNDAPALKKADIGISMGLTGTDVAKEASDMVLLDDNFATIVNAIEEGRAVFENIRKFVTYIFSSNIPEIVPYLAFVIFRIPLPLTVIQILAVDLGTDIFPALALGAEKPAEHIMKRPPRRPGEGLLNLPLIGRAYFFLGPIEAAAGLFGFFYVLKAGGFEGGRIPSESPLYIEATTACLSAIIITQMGNVFAAKTTRESVFSVGLLSNRLILIGIALEVLVGAFVIYTPLGNRIFSTAPLGADVLFVLAPFGIGIFAADELRKFLFRKLLRP